MTTLVHTLSNNAHIKTHTNIRIRTDPCMYKHVTCTYLHAYTHHTSSDSVPEQSQFLSSIFILDFYY
jgi:hypothetical protein